MFCFKCGKEIPAESAFCLHCGVKIPPLYAHEKEDFLESDFMPITPSPPTSPESSPWQEDDFELPDLFEDDITDDCAAVRRCITCGREIPESSISDECITCLHNRSFVAISPEQSPIDDIDTTQEPASKQDFQLELDLDAEYPSAYAEPSDTHPTVTKKAPYRWLIMLLAALVCIAAISFFMIPNLLRESDGRKPGTSQTSGPSNLERKVTSYAREITKNACANPDSVSFHKDAILTEENDIFTVTETFDRTSRQGEFTTTTYIAILRLDSTQSSGYAAIKLQIDDTIMFDYS